MLAGSLSDTSANEYSLLVMTAQCIVCIQHGIQVDYTNFESQDLFIFSVTLFGYFRQKENLFSVLMQLTYINLYPRFYIPIHLLHCVRLSHKLNDTICKHMETDCRKGILKQVEE